MVATDYASTPAFAGGQSDRGAFTVGARDKSRSRAQLALAETGSARERQPDLIIDTKNGGDDTALGGSPTNGWAVSIRCMLPVALVAGIGFSACVDLGKPTAVADCTARGTCSDDGQPGQTGGMGGSVAAQGGGAGTGPVSSGGAAGGTTTSVRGSGGQGATVDARMALDVRGVGGAVSSGGVGRDAGVDAPSAGGAVGSGGAGPGAGGKAGATSATGGSAGGQGGGGGVVTGGTTGGTTGAGGSSSADARPDTSATNPLLTGLVAYYPCESATGTDLADASGKGNTGKLSIGTLSDGSTPTVAGYDFATGKVGKALALHKAGVGYVKVPTAVFANATDMTIAVWVNVATSQNWQRLLDVGVDAKLSQNTQTGTKYLNIVPKNEGTNMLFSITADGYGSEQTLTGANLPTGTWTHVAVVLAAGTGGKLYVNGAQSSANTSLSLRASNLGSIDYAFLGKSQFGVDPAFDGSIDEFRVYNRALTDAEVQALYAFTGS